MSFEVKTQSQTAKVISVQCGSHSHAMTLAVHPNTFVPSLGIPSRVGLCETHVKVNSIH